MFSFIFVFYSPKKNVTKINNQNFSTSRDRHGNNDNKKKSQIVLIWLKNVFDPEPN